LHLTNANDWQSIWYLIQDNIDNRLKKELDKYYDSLQTKINRLVIKTNTHNKEKNDKQSVYPRICNMTQIRFTKQEEALLNQGTRYNIAESNLKQLIMETENAIQQIDTNQQEGIRHLAAKSIHTLMLKQNTTHQHKQQLQLIKSIKQKMHEHNAILEWTKGKTMVILYKQTLNEKVNQFINDNQIETLKSDPTQKMHKLIQNTLKHNNIPFNQNVRKRTLQMNPTALAHRAKIKIHKPQAPIPPVINNINAPSYKLATHIHRRLKELLNLKRVQLQEFSYICEKHYEIPHGSQLQTNNIRHKGCIC
jgi:hypothetical protein